jgi:hypothetical protein
MFGAATFNVKMAHRGQCVGGGFGDAVARFF